MLYKGTSLLYKLNSKHSYEIQDQKGLGSFLFHASQRFVLHSHLEDLSHSKSTVLKWARAKEVTQHLRALAALSENLCSVPSTHPHDSSQQST